VFMVVGSAFEGVQFGAIVPLADRIFTNKPIILPQGIPSFVVAWADKFNALDRYAIFYGLIIFIPVFYIFKGICGYFRGDFMNMYAQKSVADVRKDLFCKYQALSMDFYSQKRQGELMARITHDAPFIGHALSYAITDLVYQSILAVMFAGIALMISWKMVMIILVLFPLNALLIRVVGKSIKKQSIQSQESMADLNSILAETNQGVAIVKAFSREDHEIQRFGESNLRYYKAFIKSIRRNLLLAPISEILAAIAVVVVFWLGGRYVLEGKMSFGVFALF